MMKLGRVALTAAGALCAFAAHVVLLGLVLPSSKPRARTPSDRSVQVLGHELVYRSTGTGGVPLILLHGFGGSAVDWDNIVPKLACGRIITLDLLGFGASQRPSLVYNLDVQRQHLVAFMDALGIERAILAGQSMGGSLTAWTAAHHQDRIQALALLAPSAYPDSLTYRWPLSAIYGPGITNHLARHLADNALFDTLFPSSLGRQALGMTASYDARFVDALSSIEQPTLLLWSPGDATVPFHYSARFREKIPHARFVEMERSSGHFLPGAEPDRIAQLLSDFVRENQAP